MMANGHGRLGRNRFLATLGLKTSDKAVFELGSLISKLN